MHTPTHHATLETAADNGGAHAGAGERLAALLASVQDAIVTVDAAGAIESVNPAAEGLFNRAAAQLIESDFANLLADPYREEYRSLVRRFAAGESVETLGLTREVLGSRGDGSSFPLELALTEMPVNGQTLLLAVGRDISERKRTETRLRELADQDALTGLLNRRSFEEILTKHLEYAARYGGSGSLLVLDIDNFKYANDSVGHGGGDELIKGIAALIKTRLRTTDVLARLGGDEFAVLLHGADGKKAHGVAHQVRELIGKNDFVIDHQPVRVTASIGLAPLNEQRLTAAEVLAHADMAMYAAKDQGRDRVVEFTTEGQAQMADRRALSERIRRATERGLFVLVCQPILDLRTDQITQYEVLLRMRAEDGSLLDPAAFLPTAERFGLIQGIDRWVAQQAVRLLSAHTKAGRDLVLEVNLSALSMNDDEFASTVGRELIATGVEPSRLVFEVTETAAVADLEVARQFAESLTRVGCRFALDDFGAGFASFYYLKHLPISYLKIDGEFVKELTRSRADQLLVKALVQVSHGLGIKTVAEFVGDQETVDLLREFGVDYAQGYHIGKPQPIAELHPG